MNSNYKFNLESVLNYRGQLKDMLKKEFSALQETLTTEEVRLSEFGSFYDSKAAEMLGKDEIKASELEVYRNYLQLIKEKMLDTRKTIEMIQEKLDMKRTELAAASREKKVLEAVREKGLKEHLREEAKIEQTVSDEFNVNKFGK